MNDQEEDDIYTKHDNDCKELMDNGWTVIKYPANMRNMKQEPEKCQWCRTNTQGKWEKTLGGYFIFERETDAIWFTLRWS